MLLTFDAQLVSSTVCPIFIIHIIDYLNHQNDSILPTNQKHVKIALNVGNLVSLNRSVLAKLSLKSL